MGSWRGVGACQGGAYAAACAGNENGARILHSWNITRPRPRVAFFTGRTGFRQNPPCPANGSTIFFAIGSRRLEIVLRGTWHPGESGYRRPPRIRSHRYRGGEPLPPRRLHGPPHHPPRPLGRIRPDLLDIMRDEDERAAAPERFQEGD